MVFLSRASAFCKILATGVLAYTFLKLELMAISLFLIGLLILWIFGNAHQNYWISNFGFIVCLLLAGLGLKLHSPNYLMISVVILSLTAWDLDDFTKRISPFQIVQGEYQVVKKHVVNLGIVISLGILTIALSTVINVKLDFEISLVLAILAVLGLLLGVRITKENY